MPPPALRHWSTEAVQPAERLDYWVGAICEGFLEMAASSTQRQAFEGALTSAPLGAIGVNRVDSSAQDVFRTRSAIARSRENYFYLLHKTDHAWSTVQDGRVAALRPGDAVLVDSRRPYEFHFPVSATTLSLELPTAWVHTWLPDPHEAVARRIDGCQGWGLALNAYLQQWTPAMAADCPLPAALMTDQLGHLLSLAVGAAPEESPQAHRLHQRVLAALAERHAEPGLTAAQVALQLGVSERSLHRHLAAAGASFAQALMAERLRVAARMLGQARFDRLTVGEIGRRVGLSDASHFVRVCVRHLGATPAQLRARRAQA